MAAHQTRWIEEVGRAARNHRTWCRPRRCPKYRSNSWRHVAVAIEVNKLILRRFSGSAHPCPSVQDTTGSQRGRRSSASRWPVSIALLRPFSTQLVYADWPSKLARGDGLVPASEQCKSRQYWVVYGSKKSGRGVLACFGCASSASRSKKHGPTPMPNDFPQNTRSVALWAAAEHQM